MKYRPREIQLSYTIMFPSPKLRWTNDTESVVKFFLLILKSLFIVNLSKLVQLRLYED